MLTKSEGDTMSGVKRSFKFATIKLPLHKQVCDQMLPSYFNCLHACMHAHPFFR